MQVDPGLIAIESHHESDGCPCFKLNMTNRYQNYLRLYTEGFTNTELVNLRYLYEEWAHPYFISIADYALLMKVGPAKYCSPRH